jgi:hypothetical protein
LDFLPVNGFGQCTQLIVASGLTFSFQEGKGNFPNGERKQNAKTSLPEK